MREVTKLPVHQCTEFLVYNDPLTFIGISPETGAVVQHVTDDEIALAEHLLKNSESGTELKCYVYDTEPKQYIYHVDRNQNNDQVEIVSLSHTFIAHRNLKTGQLELRAISNEDGATRLELNRMPLPEGITEKEVLVANGMLQYTSAETKLHHKAKRYQKYQYVDKDNKTRFVTLTHSFIKFKNKIYALSGNGHREFGGYAKVKNCWDCADKKLMAIKFDKKERLVRAGILENEKERSVVGDKNRGEIERDLSQGVGIFITSAVKKSGVAKEGETKKKKVAQYVSLMTHYDSDLLDFLNKTMVPTLKNKSVPAEDFEKKAANFLVDIFLKMLKELVNYHSTYHILHCDIKPSNILISWQSIFPGKAFDFSVGAKTRISDLGLALALKPGQKSVIETCYRGTPGYSAPELLGSDINKNGFIFSEKTDIYSLGKTFEVLTGKVIEQLNNILTAPHLNYLLCVAKMMMHPDPESRLAVEHIEGLLNCLNFALCSGNIGDIQASLERFIQEPNRSHYADHVFEYQLMEAPGALEFLFMRKSMHENIQKKICEIPVNRFAILHRVACSNPENLLILLVKTKKNIWLQDSICYALKQQDSFGWTPLHYCIKHAAKSVVLNILVVLSGNAKYQDLLNSILPIEITQQHDRALVSSDPKSIQDFLCVYHRVIFNFRNNSAEVSSVPVLRKQSVMESKKLQFFPYPELPANPAAIPVEVAVPSL